jgi:hypothetical protein
MRWAVTVARQPLTPGYSARRQFFPKSSISSAIFRHGFGHGAGA